MIMVSIMAIVKKWADGCGHVKNNVLSVVRKSLDEPVFCPDTLQRPPVPTHLRALRDKMVLSTFLFRNNVRFLQGHPKMLKSATAQAVRSIAARVWIFSFENAAESDASVDSQKSNLHSRTTPLCSAVQLNRSNKSGTGRGPSQDRWSVPCPRSRQRFHELQMVQSSIATRLQGNKNQVALVAFQQFRRSHFGSSHFMLEASVAFVWNVSVCSLFLLHSRKKKARQATKVPL